MMLSGSSQAVPSVLATHDLPLILLQLLTLALAGELTEDSLHERLEDEQNSMNWRRSPYWPRQGRPRM
jgi:hypothetical protein